HISLFSHLDNTPTPRCYTLSLHDALPISRLLSGRVLLADMFVFRFGPGLFGYVWLRSLSLDLTTMTDNSVFSSPMIGRQLFGPRSEEHTSELQSRFDLVCRLLLEKEMIIT